MSNKNYGPHSVREADFLRLTIISLCELNVAMTTRVPIQLALKSRTGFPPATIQKVKPMYKTLYIYMASKVAYILLVQTFTLNLLKLSKLNTVLRLRFSNQ